MPKDEKEERDARERFVGRPDDYELVGDADNIVVVRKDEDD